MAYFFIIMIYFEILKTQGVSPKGIFTHKNFSFHLSVPFKSLFFHLISIKGTHCQHSFSHSPPFELLADKKTTLCNLIQTCRQQMPWVFNPQGKLPFLYPSFFFKFSYDGQRFYVSTTFLLYTLPIGSKKYLIILTKFFQKAMLIIFLQRGRGGVED